MIHTLYSTLRTASSLFRDSCINNRSIICRSIYTSGVRYDGSPEDLGPPIKKPRKYFDMKTFRQFLKQQKTHEIETEKRAIAKAHAKSPPDGWEILDFLKAINVGDGAEVIAESFNSWNEFISSTLEELYSNTSMTNKQRRTVFKYITLYNHGLWPNENKLDYVNTFQAPPLKHEGEPWNEESDAKLLELAEYYDADFGDPWIYISWEMQRTIEDVQDRYIEIFTKPKNRDKECDISITRSHKPLLMNRKFKIDPPFLYIIPSEENFPLSAIYVNDENTVPKAEHIFSDKFKRYRNDSCFKIE
ncbi:hypothetical protein BEWA_018010 [Theileria equi strain WA]|uniref:Uncharacterized protein n=1 Tax=Theileria equi strain WA TaxID=1537102 RepID=L0ATU2_THEEQ|nr:hypothetical protein BEWA_018010 [Theileria equi strain WA]AFZ78960.1 hypothetical protein BEWA_018010 [Theileria equi strain WA]|eukprot:XP_004828626.1 hypothetical protein BEWA_018010 [Theileria equi strain WA]